MGREDWRWMLPVVAAGAVGLATTVSVVSVPPVRFAYESLELHIALEAAQGVVALILCYLALGRLRATGRLRHLLLTVAFAAFAATNLFVSALPVALEGETIGYATWLAAMLRLFAALAFAAASLWPDRTVSLHGLAPRTASAMVGAAAVLIVAAAFAESTLTDLVDPRLSPEASTRPLITGEPLAVAIQIASAAAVAIAALAFVRLAIRTRDDLFRWLAAGATLGAFARLNYVLFPSLYTEWFYTGDLLRFGSYLLFLVGAAREVGVYWRDHANVAVMEERRRVARELHDGLTQELSFIRSQLTSTKGAIPPETLRFVSEAAERALVESRNAVDALAGHGDEGRDSSLGEALLESAKAVAEREGIVVTMETGPSAQVEPGVRAELARVVREAVINGVRHGRASAVHIRVQPDASSVIVEVYDNGSGFLLSAPDRRGGFGLVSMRERIEGLGGSFHVETTPLSGTTVRVVVPRYFVPHPRA